MAGRDDEKTVFGGPLPGAGARKDQTRAPRDDSPFGRETPLRGMDTGGDDRTVIGGPLPSLGRPGAGGGQSGSPFDQRPSPSDWDRPRPAPPSQGWPAQRPESGNTWIGGPQQPAYPPQQPYQPAQQGWSGQAPGYGNIGSAAGGDRGFFPDIPRDRAGQAAPMQGPKIPLQQALQVKGLGKGASTNPILAAAAPLLILLGRLRTGLVEMQAAPLMDHVTREIDQFERNLLSHGVNPHEAAVSKYILSGTADDIVQNLPGADRGDWLQYSMVARFFGKRDSGVGFFQETEKAMQVPGQSYNLLGLILTCLNLGFEGQYRTLPNGAVDLSRIRNAIYETLRRVTPRPDEDIAVTWAPVVQGKGRRFAAVSVPAILGGAAILLLGSYALLSTLINRDGAAAAEALRALHPGNAIIAIERTPGPVYVASQAQLDRIREAFAAEIADGLISVDEKGDYIAIRVGNQLLFDSGKSDVREEFAPLAARITEVLNAEGGPVLIQGYTDNVPLRGTGRFKNNEELSAARAQSVTDALTGTIDDAARFRVEGKGEADAVADNATEEGRAQNRRVEIMLAKEGTY
ncbi:type VI secretion system protein TssL, long form [Paracoccus zhejiangensis]|uniref:Type VI secretion system protein TssL n=1 Tax=Paracoccus zhejiangensis TaxID=1077935 RepID=A0A2H5F071_9RHOB|nr:type VI secretion system protein TssL, long form [Paracoccus zhejiangensis]AUH64933.1 type VI secretion system protein TssL [Paracoccus zhejiangensis]